MQCNLIIYMYIVVYNKSMEKLQSSLSFDVRYIQRKIHYQGIYTSNVHYVK